MPVWNRDASAAIRRQIPLDEYQPLEDPSAYTFDLNHLHYKSPNPQGRTEHGVLRWPTGAARWAAAHFVVTSAKLDEIREAVGDSLSAQPLVLADAVTGYTLTASLFMLPPRPLLGGRPLTDDGMLWTVPLVDIRYFWWQRLVTIDPVPATWAALIDQIDQALGGGVVEAEPVPDAYGGPTERFRVSNQPAGLLLDAVADAVGMRCVYGFDGVLRLQSWQTARTNSDANYATYTSTITSGDYIGRGRVMGGGLLVSGDIARALPGTVAVVFGRRSGGTVLSGQTVRYRHLADYTLDPGPSGLSSVFGLSAGYGLATARFTADAYDDITASGSEAVLTGLANQAARDWYGWRSADKDVRFAGILPWSLDAMADKTVWTYTDREVSTRVAREPFFDHSTYGYYPAPAASGVAAADDSFLAVLTEKSYASTFIEYSAREVTPAGDISYSLTPSGRSFSAGSTPLYHERNLDLPPVGVASGGDPNFIHPWSVVRVRRGPAGFYFFARHPVVGIFRRTGVSGSVGEEAFLRYNSSSDPGPPVWADGEAVELIEAE